MTKFNKDVYCTDLYPRFHWEHFVQWQKIKEVGLEGESEKRIDKAERKGEINKQVSKGDADGVKRKRKHHGIVFHTS